MKEKELPNNSTECQPLILKFGKDDPWPETTLPDKGDRPPMAPEEKERWNRKLGTLGKLMAGAGVWWQLDGALNISLRNIREGGDFIGQHGDIDLSLFADELPKFKAYAEAQGYGLFYYTKDKSTGQKTFVEVTGKEAKPMKGAKLRLLALDRIAGKMRTDTDLPVAGIVPYYRDPEGHFIAQWRGLVLPTKWLRDETMPFRNTTLALSHPARFVLHKLFYRDRTEYHQKDLERFVVEMGALSDDDFKDIRGVLQQSLVKLQRGRKEMENYAEYLATRSSELTGPEAIYQIIQNDLRAFYEKAYGFPAEDNPPETTNEIRRLADGLSRLAEKSRENISAYLLRFGDFGEPEEERVRATVENLEQLRQKAAE